jgi:hypothetical protein
MSLSRKYSKYLRFVPDAIYVWIVYVLNHRKLPNLFKPKTLNEKLTALKYTLNEPIFTTLCDKIEVKEYLRNHGFGDILTDTYQVVQKWEDFDFEALPEKFVVKTNHYSGDVLIVKNKQEFNPEEYADQFNSFLKNDLYEENRERQYKGINKLIFAEEFIVTSDGSNLKDYKFHCFNGKVEFIQVDIDRFSNHQRSFYSRSWEILPFNWCPKKNGRQLYGQYETLLETPENFEKMIQTAELLSVGFDYCRIDLYNDSGKILFGEITFIPGGARERFFPEKYDRIFGSKINI